MVSYTVEPDLAPSYRLEAPVLPLFYVIAPSRVPLGTLAEP